MNRTAALWLTVALLALLAPACHRKSSAAQGATQSTATMAPAPADPAPTGTDAMTQTVDVEDSRSVAEGGTDSSPSDATNTAQPQTAGAHRVAKKTKHR